MVNITEFYTIVMPHVITLFIAMLIIVNITAAVVLYYVISNNVYCVSCISLYVSI
jgi:hypothetical protein